MHKVHHEALLNAKTQQPLSFKRWIGTGAAALVLSALALPMVTQAAPTDAPAQSSGKHGACGDHGGPGGFGHGLPLRGLNLSSDQQAQVDQIKQAQKPQMQENGKTIHANMKALRELEKAPQFDQAKAQSLTQSTGQAIAANMLLHAQANQQIYQLLTPEQRAKLDAMRKKFEEQRKDRDGKGTRGQ